MRNTVLSFLLTILIEAITAVIVFLKDKLTVHLRRTSQDDGWTNHAEFV